MSSAACYLPACCEPDTTSWAPRTYAQNVMANIQYARGIRLKVCFICDNMRVWAKNLLVQFGACMHIPHAFPARPSVCAVCVHVCVSVHDRKAEQAFVQYIFMSLQTYLMMSASQWGINFTAELM